MADTRQIVSWSLERKCIFRDGGQWFLPDATCRQLNDLHTVARADRDQRILNGICVTGWTVGRDLLGQLHRVPSSGFRIEDLLRKFGSFSTARTICGQCEANANNGQETSVAGCFGYLDIWPPDAPTLEEALWNTIEARNLERRLRSAFPATSPLWYGFWIESPLRRLQAEFLRELLDAACDEDDIRNRGVGHFLDALQRALDRELPIHVSLAPLGHVDMGWTTIFPHCPRCKANAPVGRWKDKYPDEPMGCAVCGNLFVPNDHHSSERDCIDWDASSLKKLLGEEGHKRFKCEYLRHRGCTDKQVMEVLENASGFSGIP